MGLLQAFLRSRGWRVVTEVGTATFAVSLGVGFLSSTGVFAVVWPLLDGKPYLLQVTLFVGLLLTGFGLMAGFLAWLKNAMQAPALAPATGHVVVLPPAPASPPVVNVYNYPPGMTTPAQTDALIQPAGRARTRIIQLPSAQPPRSAPARRVAPEQLTLLEVPKTGERRDG